MERITITIEGMTCGHCVAAVRKALEGLPGVEVEEVRIGGATLRMKEPGKAAVDVRAAVEAAVGNAGYVVSGTGA